jgi:hypothetical protein
MNSTITFDQFKYFYHMISYRYLLFCLTIIICHSVAAQKNLWILENYYGLGHNVKENLSIKGNPAHMYEFSFSKHADATKIWHNSMRMPEVGGMVAFVVPSYTSVVGKAIGVGGNAKFWLWRSQIVNGYLRIGGGVGYVSRIYNDDIQNRLVSTHFNVFGQIRIGAEWRVSKHIELVTAANYNHFSNAGISYPNLGVDMFLGTVGLRYSFQNLNKYPMDYTKVKESTGKSAYSIRYGLGIREKYKGSKKKYAVQMLGISYAYYIKPANKITALLYIEVDEHIGNNLNKEKAAIKLPFYISDEILVGKVGASFGVGTYLYYAGGAPKSNLMLLRLGVNYYFAKMKLESNHNIQFYVGAFIKAHSWNANLLEMSLGLNFR